MGQPFADRRRLRLPPHQGPGIGTGPGTHLQEAAGTRHLPLGGAPGIRSYVMADNALKISRVTLDISPDLCLLTVTDHEGEHTVVMGMGGWTLCETTMPGADLHHGYAR